MKGVVIGVNKISEKTGENYLPVFINSAGDPEVVTSLGSADSRLNLNGDVTGNATSVTHETGNGFSVAGYKTGDNKLYYNTSVTINASNVLMGAAWNNDFAEFRKCSGDAGSCMCEVGDGSLAKTTKRLQKGCSIISDTYGMVIGPDTEDHKAIAVAGRVLAYTDGSDFKPGDPVCSGKNGTISKMTRLEVILFPDRIVGYVSEIPTYKEWNKVIVNDRIWIKIN